MANKNEKDRNQEEIERLNKSPEELLSAYDDKKNELEKKKQRENPDGRVTGYELKGIVNSVAGIRNQINGQVVEEGLAKKRFDKNRKFATKITKNFREAKNELNVIESICPEYPEDLKRKVEDYENRRLQIAKENAGIEDEKVQSVTMGQIKSAGNEKIFEAEIEALDESFSETLARQERIDNKTHEIMQRPLAKPNFDMIKECEIPAELNVAEIDAIWPMIEKGDC